MAKIRCPLNEAACMSPNQPGIVSEQGILLYAETEQSVAATAELLARNGVTAGDCVGLILKNGWEQIVLFWALVRLGAVSCPLYDGCSVSAVQKFATDLSMRFLVTDRSELAVDGITTIPVTELVGFTAKFRKEFRAMLEINSPAVIHITVGTDGAAKYVEHTVGSCYYAALGGNGTFPLRSTNHRWLMKPLYTYQGTDVLFRCAISGAAATVLDDASLITVEDINKYEITHLTCATSGDVQSLIEMLDGAENELTHVLISGQTDGLQFDALKKVAPVFVAASIGSPETGYFAENTRYKQLVPFRYAELRQSAADTLQVRSSGLCAGYLVDGILIPCADAEGWYDTGLRVIKDGSGDLFFEE